MPDSQQRLEKHHSSTIEHGFDGSSFSPSLIFPAMFSSNHSNHDIRSPSFLHSPTPSDERIILDPKFLNRLATQSEIPSIMWLRPSATINNLTHDWTEMRNLRRFYSTSTKRTAARIHPRFNKKHSQDVFSHSYSSSEKQRDSGQKQISALEHFFYVMQSCEYLSVGGQPRKTKRLRFRNLRFFCNRCKIKHSSNYFLDVISYLSHSKIKKTTNTTTQLQCMQRPTQSFAQSKAGPEWSNEFAASNLTRTTPS